jgi:hypothetical protein
MSSVGVRVKGETVVLKLSATAKRRLPALNVLGG